MLIAFADNALLQRIMSLYSCRAALCVGVDHTGDLVNRVGRVFIFISFPAGLELRRTLTLLRLFTSRPANSFYFPVTAPSWSVPRFSSTLPFLRLFSVHRASVSSDYSTLDICLGPLVTVRCARRESLPLGRAGWGTGDVTTTAPPHTKKKWRGKGGWSSVELFVFHSKSLVVRCVMHVEALIGPFIFPGRLTGVVYLQFLQEELPLLLEDIPSRRHYTIPDSVKLVQGNSIACEHSSSLYAILSQPIDNKEPHIHTRTGLQGLQQSNVISCRRTTLVEKMQRPMTTSRVISTPSVQLYNYDDSSAAYLSSLELKTSYVAGKGCMGLVLTIPEERRMISGGGHMISFTIVEQIVEQDELESTAISALGQSYGTTSERPGSKKGDSLQRFAMAAVIRVSVASVMAFLALYGQISYQANHIAVSLCTALPVATTLNELVKNLNGRLHLDYASWLDYSPPILANRARFPAGSLPNFRMCESYRWSAVFIGDLLFPPPPFPSAAAPFSPHFTCIGSKDLDVTSDSEFETKLVEHTSSWHEDQQTTGTPPHQYFSIG
ncbi:hypothetical protein PR048_001631 [Dryococelus australis]|uniref:Uncharacterized protein n=1 Tax=Dryococelus australis TaxID=614101 RepID=A0ABQ9IIL2_9NEOP|nr:hypothetical protein PR048_001631 [Dryococelus australis]